MTSTPWTQATRFAERHHGVVTRSELRRAGLSDSQVNRLLSAHKIVALHRGVYRLGGVPPSRQADVTAALLASGPKAFASHRTAAAIWGTPGLEPATPEITVVGHALPRLDGVNVHRTTLGLTPLDVVRHGIWRVTRPALTLMQLGAVVDSHEVEKACEWAVLTGLVTPDELEVVLDRFGGPGSRGAAVLRAILDARTESPESELEWLLLGIVRRYCSFEPVIQHEVVINGRRYRLDLAVPDVKVSIEGVGRLWHDGKAASAADTRRRTAITAAGWSVLEYRWADCKQRPRGIGREIEATVRNRRSQAS